jgi:hypothetical protein
MRNFGLIAILVGVIGFFYAGDQMSQHDPVPPDMRIMESLEYPAGKWQTAQYAAAFLGFLGGLMAMFPKGR